MGTIFPLYFSFAKFTRVLVEVLFFYIYFRKFVKVFKNVKVNVKLSRCFKIEDNFVNASQYLFSAWQNWITYRGHLPWARHCKMLFTLYCMDFSQTLHDNCILLALFYAGRIEKLKDSTSVTFLENIT